MGTSGRSPHPVSDHGESQACGYLTDCQRAGSSPPCGISSPCGYSGAKRMLQRDGDTPARWGCSNATGILQRHSDIQPDSLDTPLTSFYTTSINMSSSVPPFQAKKVSARCSLPMGHRASPRCSVWVGQPSRPAPCADGPTTPTRGLGITCPLGGLVRKFSLPGDVQSTI